jgi:hypothetical protein
VDLPCPVRNPSRTALPAIFFQNPEMRPENVTQPLDRHKSIDRRGMTTA